MNRWRLWCWLGLMVALVACTGNGVEGEGAAAAEARAAGASSEADPVEAAGAERDELVERVEAYQAEADFDAELPPSHVYYMGRPVAMTMHWRGAEWLTRETREREENTAAVMEQLPLEPGMVVCDLGAGIGYYTLKIADVLGEAGTVIAQEIQPEMLEMLAERAEENEAPDIIVPVLGTLVDPMLPPDSCDLIIMVDVYHEFSHPEHMLRRLRDALKPDGQLVLLEYRAEDPGVPIRADHRMSLHQVELEMEANGFRIADTYDDLPWQHMLFLERDEEWDEVPPGERFQEELETADPPRPSREIQDYADSPF